KTGNAPGEVGHRWHYPRFYPQRCHNDGFCEAGTSHWDNSFAPTRPVRAYGRAHTNTSVNLDISPNSVRKKTPLPDPAPVSGQLARAIKLALFSHALKRFVGALDAVLVLLTVRRQQLYHLVGTIGGHLANWARSEVHYLADLELMLFF